MWRSVGLIEQITTDVRIDEYQRLRDPDDSQDISGRSGN